MTGLSRVMTSVKVAAGAKEERKQMNVLFTALETGAGCGGRFVFYIRSTFTGNIFNMILRFTSTVASLISQYGIQSGPKDKAHILKHSLKEDKLQLDT